MNHDNEAFQKLVELGREEIERNGKKLARGLETEWKGKKITLAVSDKVTGALRARLRKHTANMPVSLKEKAGAAIEKMNIENEGAPPARKKKMLISEYGLAEQELIDYLNPYFEDLEYGEQLDRWNIEYFKLILDSASAEIAGGLPEGFWHEALNIPEAKELVRIFRIKHEI